MIIYLLVSGLISLIFGILFLLAPAGFWERAGGFLNKPVLIVEKELRQFHFPAGILFLILGAWLIFQVIADPVLWFFHIIGIAFVIAGLLYLFVPDWLLWLSKLSGKEILTFDQIAIASRISMGIVLILVAVYIFLKLWVALRI